MEQELPAGLGKRQIAEFIEHDEIHPAKMLGNPPLAAGAPLGLKSVDQFDDVEEPAAFAVTDQGSCHCNGQVRLPRAGSADQHDVALVGKKVPACQIADQRLVDRRVAKQEVIDILGQWQLGDRDLVSNGPCLLLADLGGQQITDNAGRFMLALGRHSDDLVIGGLHAIELQLAHGGQDLGTLHYTALLRLSYRLQSAIGACRSCSASGVTIVSGGAGWRLRAKMLRTTSAE